MPMDYYMLNLCTQIPYSLRKLPSVILAYVLCLLLLRTTLVRSVGYLYLRVLDPPEFATIFKLTVARIGPPFNTTNEHYLVPIKPESACEPFTRNLETDLPLAGHIAFILRGGCSFVTKVINAHVAGAVAAIVYDYTPTSTQTFSMVQDETSRRVLIPSAFMTGKDGHTILDALENWNRTRIFVDFPLNRTSSSSVRLRINSWTLW
ncbi:hypothetical protein T265_07750 [Opisthorchis viverrini]|uniref:PA domain-containing protein n=1 Tax=Opisthorchis viverrini TaxID=6198 RepID=A0A074ZMW4_OPIVI|nr:hypothetical protein T265_07750 [Opisthorchis viverrini]KER24655.1 hypothetical protein T265_07750 [Opisthorchis viverrini]